MVAPPMMPPRSPMPPPAFGPPPQGMQQPGNPVALLASLKQLVGTPLKAPEPIYRSGYKPPKKPETDVILARGKLLYSNARLWRHMIFTTLMWADQKLTGMFPEDEADRAAGFQEEWVSPLLSAERALVISIGASHKLSFRSPSVEDALRGFAHRKEDAARWIRDEEAYKHVSRGNSSLEYDEAKLFTDYGMYASRDTLSPRDTTCPVTSLLIDPSQVHPIYRRDGLDAVYRVYRATVDEIVASYGDFSDRIWEKLQVEKGDEIGGETELDVTEYWDTWWRCVMVGSEVVISPTAHEYGDCPWTVQYGNSGNPMFTRTATDVARRIHGNWSPQSSNWATDRVSKAVPYLYYHLKNHELYEAVGARVVTGFKKDINPPVIRYRSDAASEKPMPQLDASPGAQNEAMYQEEKIEAMPTVNTGTTTLALQMIQQDMQAISAPPQMRGVLGGTSNVTGVAQSEANDAGMYLIAPMRAAWESAMGQKYDRILRMFGNFGHLAKYGNGEKRPIMVPAKKGAYEFDREIMEKVGTRVRVTLTNVNPRMWPQLAMSGEKAVSAGFLMRKDVREVMTGETDYDTFYEEWQEEQAMFMMTTNPDFQKLNMLAVIEEQIEENDGRPQVQAGLVKIRALWEQMMQPPQQPPPQPGMGGAPPPGMPPQGGQPMGGPPMQPQGGMPAPGNPMSPGVPGQMSYPQLGMGPGSQGAPVGRPY